MIKIFKNAGGLIQKTEVFSLKPGAVINARVTGKLSDTGYLLKYLNNTFQAKSDVPLKLNEMLFLQVAHSGKVTVLKILNSKKQGSHSVLTENLHLRTGISREKLELLIKHKMPLDFNFLAKLKNAGLLQAENNAFLFFARLISMGKKIKKDIFKQFSRLPFELDKSDTAAVKKLLKSMTFLNIKELMGNLKDDDISGRLKDYLIRRCLIEKVMNYDPGGSVFSFFYEDDLKIKDFKARKFKQKDGIFIINFTVHTQKFSKTDVYVYYTKAEILSIVIVSEKKDEIMEEMKKSGFKFTDKIKFESGENSSKNGLKKEIKNIDIKI